MTLENFPQTFTHTITSEITANADGAPVSVVVSNFGGMSKTTVRDIAHEAITAWEGRYNPEYLITGWEQCADGVVRVYVTNV